MKSWQLGYRFPKSLQEVTREVSPGKFVTFQWGCDFETPYLDLPPFQAPEIYAEKIVGQLQADFPQAEWRLVECV